MIHQYTTQQSSKVRTTHKIHIRNSLLKPELNPRTHVSHVTDATNPNNTAKSYWSRPFRRKPLRYHLHLELRTSRRIFCNNLTLVTYRLRELGVAQHPMVAGKCRRAVLCCTKPGRAELLPAHVREACTADTARIVC
jgi:hypothetical protein